LQQTSARPITFTSEDLTLEGILHEPALTPFPAAIVCHPHPLYGGDMNNNVVVAVCQALAEAGIAGLRFNYRGVGRSEGKYGDGLAEIRKLGLHNKHKLICVAATFSHVPWYADHPTDPAVRHESYLLKVVLPLVEARHPALAQPQGRLLVGFSKSGWGAFSLLLRHADVFGRAAAWDAPMMEQAPTKFGMAEVFGTQENFERYRITALVERQAGLLKDGAARLVLLGYGNFRTPTEGLHRRMLALGIPHVYDNATERRHHWESGWFAGAVRRLMELAPAPDGKTGAP